MIKYEVRVYENGTQEWSLNGRDHREDGPAYTRTDGYKAWFKDGQLHRIDGPAIIEADGTKHWYLNGVRVTEADVMGHKITVDGKEVTLSAESYKALKESINA